MNGNGESHPKISAHDQAVINQWPKADDPREHRIVGEIRSALLTTDWAKKAIEQAGDIQLEHLRVALEHKRDPQLVHDSTQETLAKLSELMHSDVIEGKEYLEALPKGKPVLLLTNHLGIYKLNSWDIDTLRQKTGLKGPVQPLFYPFPLYYAAMYPVAKALENKLYIASFEYPGQLGEVMKAVGTIEVPPKETLPAGQDRTAVLIESTRKAVENHPNAVITSFPEGGTTGKRNGKGPYDLEEPWHTGSYVIARELGLTIVPVAQYFNPEKGFELRVFEPAKLGPGASEDEIKKISQTHFREISEWLKAKA